MKFAKTLAAATVLAAVAGSAQAAKLGDNSAFLQVYSASAGQTYDLNLDAVLGLNYTSLATHASFSLDLTTVDSNWATFAGANGANLVGSKFFVGATDAVVASTYYAFQATRTDATAISFPDAMSLDTAAGNVNIDNQRINWSSQTIPALLTANSKIVADAVADTGGWAAKAGSPLTADNLWGSFALAHAGIAYGSTGNYFQNNDDVNLGPVYTKLGSFTLSGNTLSYVAGSAPAAVPLPAAVWMFGAGLMGFLGLNRRKSAAV